ncbi:unnamed protein product, partial [Ectocarpus sp. 12 AP-2014]
WLRESIPKRLSKKTSSTSSCTWARHARPVGAENSAFNYRIIVSISQHRYTGKSAAR